MPFILKWFKAKYICKTPREFQELNNPEAFPYMEIYGFLLTVLLMAMTYALVAPVIIVFSLIVFILGYIVFKYQLFYVFETDIESGGLWWPILFDMICFCVFVFQLCTFGALVMVGADQSSSSPVSKIPNWLVAPLPILTFLFWVYVTYFVRPKTELVGQDFEIPPEIDIDDHDLSDRIFNPAIVDNLLKVWVNSKFDEQLTSIYKPKYQNITDFVQKTDPERLEKIKEMEKVRESKRKSVMIGISSRAVFFSAQQSIDTFYSCDDVTGDEQDQHNL